MQWSDRGLKKSHLIHEKTYLFLFFFFFSFSVRVPVGFPPNHFFKERKDPLTWALFHSRCELDITPRCASTCLTILLNCYYEYNDFYYVRTYVRKHGAYVLLEVNVIKGSACFTSRKATRLAQKLVEYYLAIATGRFQSSCLPTEQQSLES